MKRQRLSLLTRPLLALAAFLLGADPGWAAAAATKKSDPGAGGSQTKVTDVAGRVHVITKKVTQAERQAAADRLKAKMAARLKAPASSTQAASAGAVAAAAAAIAPAGGYLVGPNNQLVPDYSGLTANWAYSPLLTKFVDPLPGLYIHGIGQQLPGPQFIPVAEPKPWPVGCTPLVDCDAVDYYEIELAEYDTWSFHSELPNKTKLRGYAQTNASDSKVNGVHSYLGPVILAQKGRPVRVKFTNNLPAGAGGNLYIPADATILGAGPGPNVSDELRTATPADVLCMPGTGGVIPPDCFTQNRATIHLHGGVTPWISDGTTHQWITPDGDPTPYKNGVSVYNVPDMPNPGKPDPVIGPGGVQTFYWTNDQAARLMFYHDHAMGITRLNVYVGEAAGYLLRDDAEAGLEAAGLIPGLLDNIPLVIQEKAFVDAATIGATDPTWNWGTGTASPYTDSNDKTIDLKTPVTGDLWWPHVYQPAQNPYDLSGYNATGRWNYGPWFFPPTPIPYGPVPNPYYDALTAPWQPPMIPGTPNPSWGAEAFLDTPVINGTAYPTLTVKAQPYRFRILNAGGDRFVNLQLYQAFSSAVGDTTAGGAGGAEECNTATPDCSEVKMVPATGLGLPPNWPRDNRDGGVPDPATIGPSFWVIGTEGGFLPMPVEVKPQPVVWNNDPLTFNFGNVSDFSLLLGPAERADAIVDFSGMAGRTFILYNDAPAAFPALDPRNDYYTGNPDQTDTGGTVPTLPGKGPNTRTLMQIHVEGAGSGSFDPALLQEAFTTDLAATPPRIGVFRASQDPIIVGQSDTLFGVPAYEAAYGTTFPSRAPYWGLGSIFNSNVSFQTVDGQQVTLLAQPKAIHDEMGATFDDYGRMKASLGVQMPNPTPNLANFIMQGYADPATELVKLVTTPIGNPTADGTQIWRVNHNGVDTHPIHFHLFHVQVVNRVGWDGAYRLPHPTELGWKDTVRISPLEDTYVALRPIAPRPESLPFKIPNSFRPLDPTLPIGSTLGFTNVDPLGNPIVPGIANHVANFGWEYVWHCHILAHEENDMMRAVVFAAPPETPTGLTATVNGNDVVLSWTNPSLVASGFSVQRATNAGFTSGLVTTPLGLVTTSTDRPATAGTYYYRVFASNTVGSGVPNYPTITADSLASNTATVVFAPAATMVVQPTALVFGDQLVGTNSAVRTVALTNNGTATVTINSVTFSIADFSRNGGNCAGTLLAGRTCTINVRFNPTVTGVRTGQVVINTSAAGPAPTVALSGNGIAPVASAVPPALTFSTPLNVPSTSQLVTVTNTGTAPLTINNVTRTGPHAGQFTHVNGCTGTWPVGGSCTITVTFLPTAASPVTKNAVLNVVVAAPGTNATVALRGNIIVPTFTVTPSPLAFGNQSVSGGVKQLPVTVTNTGAAPLRITAINRTGQTAQFPPIINVNCPISPATLAAGASCTVTAGFDPTTAGLKTATLNVNVGAPAANQSVPMSGTGQLP